MEWKDARCFTQIKKWPYILKSDTKQLDAKKRDRLLSNFQYFLVHLPINWLALHAIFVLGFTLCVMELWTDHVMLLCWCLETVSSALLSYGSWLWTLLSWAEHPTITQSKSSTIDDHKSLVTSSPGSLTLSVGLFGLCFALVANVFNVYKNSESSSAVSSHDIIKQLFTNITTITFLVCNHNCSVQCVSSIKSIF